ncbi:MAG: Holliday junction resolvase RuvX [Bacteroidetes bacterium]|nr:MAG: Holliday junction resolvase RuvX [Bacteroidota bacterium]
MSRIIAIDYGAKRVGLAVSDPLQMIANPLETVANKDIFVYLKKYFSENEVESIVLGIPSRLDSSPTHATPQVEAFKKKLLELFPDKKIHEVDERFTSKMAAATLIAGGMKKKDRQNKENLDKVSAAIILQHFLEFR